MEIVNSALRAFQFLWTLLLTALIGNVIANNHNGPMGSVNLAMFTAVLSWLALLYGLVASFVTSLAMPLVMMVLDGLAVLFTFITAVVLAARLGAPNCSHIGGRAGDYIAYGSSDNTKRCREIQASDVFLWFLFACFIASLFFSFKAFRSMGGGSHRGPSMSQVGV
ncbi:marvel domain-containing protein [Apiospora arundinis]|jgi:hypothetical protein